MRSCGKNPIVVGLIGGVGSGKSTVARLFKAQGAGVIQADDITYQVLKLPTIKKKLFAVWGPSIFNNLGEVDRTQLSRKVFRNRREINRLMGIVHPPIRKILNKEMAIQSKKHTLVVLEAALLLEAGYASKCDWLVFVETSRDNRMKRASARRGWTRREIFRRERYQMPLQEKRKYADYIVNNNRSRQWTFKQVRKVYRDILNREHKTLNEGGQYGHSQAR